MTSNKGAAGFTVRMQASRNDFERYLHSVGNTGVEKEASIIETSIAKRILDICIKRCKLELQNEKDAKCKALKNVAEIIFDKCNATIEELGKTTGLYARNNLIGQIEAYAMMLNVVNTMLTHAFQNPSAKSGQEAGDAD